MFAVRQREQKEDLTLSEPSMEMWVEEYPDTWHPHSSRLPDEAFEVCPQDLDDFLIGIGERDEADQGFVTSLGRPLPTAVRGAGLCPFVEAD